MDHIIAKPLKRLFSNSKEYAKKHFNEKYKTHAVEYSADPEDAIIMTEIRSIMRTPPKSCDSRKHIIKYNVLFDEKLKISTPEMLRNNCTLNNCNELNINEEFKNSTNLNNNTIEHVTVKLLENPAKEIVTILDLSHAESNKLVPENSELNNDEKPKHVDDVKKTQHIKLKIVVPRNTLEKKSNKTDLNQKSDCLEKLENDTEIVQFTLETQCSEQYEDQRCNTDTNTENTTESTENEIKSEPCENKSGENENCMTDTSCIFEENKACPLSPVLPSEKTIPTFPVVDDLIDFHERQMVQLTGRYTDEKNPIMGMNALRSRSQIPQSSTLDDSEIVSALVRDRFVVNMYESRTCRRRRSKPSRFGRIYRSLERTVGTDFSSNMLPDKKQIFNNTVHEGVNINKCSPIKLSNQLVSLNMNPTSVTKPVEGICQVFENAEKNNEKVLTNDNEKNNTSNLECSIFKPIENTVEIENLEEKTEDLIATNQVQGTHINLKEEVILPETVTPVPNEDACSVVSSSTLDENDQHLEEEQTNANKNAFDSQHSNKETLENSHQTDASYDMEEFLKKALGDELCNDTSSLDATNEPKILKPPLQKYILAEDSICTSDASDLISKKNTFQSNFYRSLTRKLQNMSNTFRAPPSSKHEIVADDDLDSIFPNNAQATELVRQAAVQYEAMKQISKALMVCRNTKEFASSMEQTEGERLLLVAANKRQAILNELRRLDYAGEETNACFETGSVTISDVTFPLKNEISEQQTGKRDQKQWFTCIFTCGSKVFATQSVLAKSDGTVRFPEKISFTDLPSDFTICVELFTLLQKRSSRNFSHESKFHINKCSKSSRCPTPKKFLHREKLAQKIPARYDSGIRTSSFKSCGSLDIQVSDLAKRNPWSMRKIPICSPVQGTVILTLENTVEIPVRHSGFLTIGIEVGGCTAWNRRWCVISGHIVRFWNYPCDEDSFSPLHEIDLKKCVNAQVDIVDRSLCAKPRTLLLETISETEFAKKCLHETHTLQRYLLSADNTAELHLWKKNLNTVISALRIWNAGYVF